MQNNLTRDAALLGVLLDMKTALKFPETALEAIEMYIGEALELMAPGLSEKELTIAMHIQSAQAVLSGSDTAMSKAEASILLSDAHEQLTGQPILAGEIS